MGLNKWIFVMMCRIDHSVLFVEERRLERTSAPLKGDMLIGGGEVAWSRASERGLDEYFKLIQVDDFYSFTVGKSGLG